MDVLTMNDYSGVIIEESLTSKNILNALTILDTKTEEVTEKHQTPWLTQWRLHTVCIDPNIVFEVASELSHALEAEHPWYADFNNEERYFVIYKNKIFSWEKGDTVTPQKAQEYGISLGIPEYQVNFPS